MKKHNTIEILYILDGSDNRGRRVFIREGMCENVLWPGEVLQEQDVKLLGIGGYRKQIEGFLSYERANAH